SYPVNCTVCRAVVDHNDFIPGETFIENFHQGIYCLYYSAFFVKDRYYYANHFSPPCFEKSQYMAPKRTAPSRLVKHSCSIARTEIKFPMRNIIIFFYYFPGQRVVVIQLFGGNSKIIFAPV